MNLFVTWGYSESPPSEKFMMPFHIIDFILNPLIRLVAYLDYNIIRVSDWWYYASAIISALIWSSLIIWLYISKQNKIANQNMEPMLKTPAE